MLYVNKVEFYVCNYVQQITLIYHCQKQFSPLSVSFVTKSLIRDVARDGGGGQKMLQNEELIEFLSVL